MGNLDIYEKVRSVPEAAKKTIQAGRTKGFTDINPMWRIKKLTELFGPCGFGWYFETLKKWTETVNNEVCAFVDINLFIKWDGEWSKPIFGTGGSKLAAMEKAGLYVSDECYKMATTDALSVACKELGIGADVYWEKDKTKYDSKEPTDTPDVPTMNDADKSELIAYMKKNNLSIQKVCEKYKVQYLEQLTPGSIKAILNPNNLGYFQQKCSV